MKYYFIGLLLFQPIEEIYTCNHPNTIDNNQQLLCNWTDADFVKLNDGTRVLRPKRKLKKIEAKLRKYIEKVYGKIK